MRYNLLTLQLLYEGYSADVHPDFVQVCTSKLPGKNPLRNLSGGFEYTRSFLNEMVFKTPCGKYVLGSNVFDNLGYIIDWTPENNNPVIRCPYAIGEFSCDKVHPLLKSEKDDSWSGKKIQFCSCSMANEPYDYENSIEKVNVERDKHVEKRFQEFSEKKNGHVCRNHCKYDEKLDEWKMNYSPERCAKQCYSVFCPVLGKALEQKKANVYYDILTKGIFDYGLYEEEWERVKKGVRFFDKPVSRDICEAFVRMESDQISRKFRLENENVDFEIMNIRVESRPHRDLEQDLRDISEGRFVSWAPSDEKMAKEEKRQRRAEAKEKRIRKLEKKIIEQGIEKLETVEYMRAEKEFSEERMEELVQLHKEQLKESVYEQVTLFDD